MPPPEVLSAGPVRQASPLPNGMARETLRHICSTILRLALSIERKYSAAGIIFSTDFHAGHPPEHSDPLIPCSLVLGVAVRSDLRCEARKETQRERA